MKHNRTKTNDETPENVMPERWGLEGREEGKKVRRRAARRRRDAGGQTKHDQNMKNTIKG